MNIQSILSTILLPLKAIGLIASHKKLLILSILPLIVAALCQIYLMESFYTGLENSLARLMPYETLRSIVSGVVGVIAFLVGVATFGFVATAIATPFSDFLAEATEEVTDPVISLKIPFSFRVTSRNILIDIAKSISVLFLSLIFLVLAFLPLVGFIAIPAFWFLMAFQFVSYPQTRRGVGFIKSLNQLTKHPVQTLTFGAVFSFLFAIPFVAAFVLPVAVVSGTLLYAHLTRKYAY